MVISVITEEEVEQLLLALRDADVDKKAALLQNCAARLEGVSSLPERAIDGLIVAVGAFIRSPSHIVLASTLAFLQVFLPLVPASSVQLRLALSHLLSPLVERANDSKDKIHDPARRSLVTLGRKVYADDPSRSKEKANTAATFETVIKEALSGRGTRGKLEILSMLTELRNSTDARLPLKPWLPPLVSLLEDGDGTVRDQAKEAVIALCAPPSTPPAARSELKRLILAQNVRKSIADSVLARVLGGPSDAVDPQPSAEPSSEDVPIVYIASARDLESEFKTMLPHFTGKETEHNWGPRERAVLRMRGMLRGRVYTSFPEAFSTALRGGIMDGVVKTLMSLRTTVALHSCALVQELAEHLGPAFDFAGEQLLPTLGRMAGFTKRLVAERSQKATTAIFEHSTINPRILVAHTAASTSDKSVQTRVYGLGHLKTLLDRKSLPAEIASDAELVVRRGLLDNNPQVREQARITFWSFDAAFTKQSATILSSMDGTAKRQLEKANPRGEGGISHPPMAKPRVSSAKSAILAAKRAKAAELAASRSASRGPSPSSGPASPSNFPIPADSNPREPTSPLKLAAAAAESNPAHARRSSLPDDTYTSERAGAASPTPNSPRTAFESHLKLKTGPTPPPRSPPPASSGSLSPQRPRTESPPSLVDSSVLKPTTRFSSSSSETGSNIRTPVPQGLAEAILFSPAPMQIDPAEEARRAQAAQGISAAQQLLDYDDDQQGLTQPITPARTGRTVRSMPFSTPLGRTPQTWEESPKAVTPKLLKQLMDRGYERNWWNERRKLLASELSQVDSIDSDLRAISGGSPSVSNFQRISRFSSTHSADSEVWRADRLFDRTFDGIVALMDPQQPIGILEQALVALWELVQNQWPLVESREDSLLDGLFRLRLCPNPIVRESTNSLMSLLTEVCDPPYLLLLLQSALNRSLSAVTTGPRAKAAVFNYGLNAIGMCILRLPREAVEVEARRLEPLVMGALSLDTPECVQARQAANRLILAVQCMLENDTKTLALFPSLSKTQRSFVTYQMDRNGVLKPGSEARLSIHHELVEGMVRGSRLTSARV